MEDLLDKKSDFEISSKSAFSNEEKIFSSLSYDAFLAKSSVPSVHKKLANNYIIIKKIFKFQTLVSKISNSEKSLLSKYNFNVLEETTAKQMYSELILLQKWDNDIELKEDAEKILMIRIKELKFLGVSRYLYLSDEIYNGYICLERYLQEISRYCN